MPLLTAPLRAVADYALPPRCPSCGAITQGDHRLCAPCWGALTFLGDPACAACRLPFEYDRGEGAWCAMCMADPPLHAGIHAAVAYDDVAAAMILKLKYGGRMAIADTVARLIRPHVPDDIDLIVPVPLHRRRIWSRGFNQAALIAGALGKANGVPVALDILRRTRATPVLRGMAARARAKALAGAFALAPAAAERVKGRRLLLVDDVYTSGATTNACIRVLRRAGAQSVAIAAWARVLPDTGGD